MLSETEAMLMSSSSSSSSPTIDCAVKPLGVSKPEWNLSGGRAWEFVKLPLPALKPNGDLGNESEETLSARGERGRGF